VKTIGNLKAVTFLLVSIPVVGIVLYLLLFREPAYEGRRLSDWVADLTPSGRSRAGYSPTQVAKAQKAVRAIGTNALPYLVKTLRTRDSALRRTLIDLARKQSLINIRFTTENARLNCAIAAFKALGTDAEPAVPVLVSWIENPDAENVDARSRMLAIAVLRELGPPAKSAIPTLIKVLKEHDPRAKANAAMALGRIGEQPSAVIPALMVCLDDADPVVRGNSIGALTRFGERAKAAVPALENSLHDTNGNVSRLAELALKRIEPERASQKRRDSANDKAESLGRKSQESDFGEPDPLRLLNLSR